MFGFLAPGEFLKEKIERDVNLTVLGKIAARNNEVERFAGQKFTMKDNVQSEEPIEGMLQAVTVVTPRLGHPTRMKLSEVICECHEFRRPTVELTRRRDFIQASPDESS